MLACLVRRARDGVAGDRGWPDAHSDQDRRSRCWLAWCGGHVMALPAIVVGRRPPRRCRRLRGRSRNCGCCRWTPLPPSPAVAGRPAGAAGCEEGAGTAVVAVGRRCHRLRRSPGVSPADPGCRPAGAGGLGPDVIRPPEVWRPKASPRRTRVAGRPAPGDLGPTLSDRPRYGDRRRLWPGLRSPGSCRHPG